MIKVPTGVIRKIVVGTDPKNGLAFTVGHEAIKDSGSIICNIIEDENSYHLFGNIRYFVYYKTKANEVVLWKSFVSVPISIEYDGNSTKSFA